MRIVELNGKGLIRPRRVMVRAGGSGSPRSRWLRKSGAEWLVVSKAAGANSAYGPNCAESSSVLVTWLVPVRESVESTSAGRSTRERLDEARTGHPTALREDASGPSGDPRPQRARRLVGLGRYEPGGWDASPTDTFTPNRRLSAALLPLTVVGGCHPVSVLQ